MSISIVRWVIASLLAIVASGASALPANVLFQQSGVDVTVEDVEQFVQQIPEGDRPGFFASPKRVEQMLQLLLTKKLVVRDVRQKRIGADPILQNAPALDDEELYRQQMERIRDASSVPDLTDLARELYLADPTEYAVKGRRHVRYLMAAMEQERERGAPTASGVESARAAITKLDEQVRSDRGAFDVLFDRYSQRAGEDGIIAGEDHDAGSDRHPDALRSATLELQEPGSLSGVVQAPLAFYIVQLVSKEADRQPAFEEVKDSIIEAKRNEYIRRQVDEYLGGLRTTPPEVNHEALDALLERYALKPQPKTP